MTSTIALVTLALFIPLAVGAFFVMRPLTAALVVALGAEMFLPEVVGFKVPLVPVLAKDNLPYLCIALGCMMACRRKFTKVPRRARVLLVPTALILSSMGTALTNTDPLTYGQAVWAGLTLKDGVFVAFNAFFPSWVAYYIGYALVREKEDVDKVLIALAVAGLLYCPFAIVEMRMSPQFHQWIYGYNTGDFAQTIRFGGYRPKVFMRHGLTLARFLMNSTLALFLLAKQRHRLFGIPTRLLAWFHFVVLVLCRSTGAILLAVVGILCISLTKPKRQLLLASVLGIATLTYPLLRTWGVFPVTTLLEASGHISSDRSGSLQFRFKNEDLLLARARERILFGWGYGRNFVYNDDGQNTTVVDGYWIIVVGMAGTIAFVLSFGMLLWPVLRGRRRLMTHGTPADKTQLAGMAVMVALWTSDLIPNGLWAVYQYLVAGVLLRRLVELHPTSEGGAAGKDRWINDIS